MQSNTKQWRSSWVKKVALAAAAATLTLGLCEVLARTSGRAPRSKSLEFDSLDCVYRRSTNPILGFELKSNYRNQQPDFIKSYARTNSHGQRDRERKIEKPAGVERILVLGDSVVEGYGLPESDTLTAQMERLLADGTEVLNFGVSAYCTRAEVELLEVKGLRFAPDVVVLVFVENDYDNFNREAFPLDGVGKRPPLVETLFAWSHLFRLAAVHWNLFQFAAELDPVRWNQIAIGNNNVVTGLSRLRQLADQHGFQPVVAIWPRFYDERIDDVCYLPESRELIVERLAAANGIPSRRLSDYFRRELGESSGSRNPRLRYTLGDGLHPSAEGNRVAASALRQTIADLKAGRLTASQQDIAADAIQAAKALGGNRPSYARVYNRLGTELLRANKTNEAVRQFRRALREDPKLVGAHNNLGVALERLGSPDAQQHFAEAIRLEPDFVPGHFNLGRILQKQGQIEAAMRAFRRTIELDPRHLGALNRLGRELGKRGQLQQALRVLTQAVRVDPHHSQTENNLGSVYAAQGRLKEASLHFERALRLDPTNSDAARNLKRVQAIRDGARPGT